MKYKIHISLFAENIFQIIKLQDLGNFIGFLSKNIKIQEKIVDWLFSDIKNNKNVSYANFACGVEKITPNIWNLELLKKLKILYTNENDPSIFAIQLDKINWHINILNNIHSYKN